LILNESVEDGGHQEVSDASTRVTKTSSESIASAGDILVEEASAPHLAGHKATSEDADEEAKSIELRNGECGARQEGWDGADEQAAGERLSGTEMIANWASHKPVEESCCKSDDVGVGDFNLGELKIFLDGDVDLSVFLAQVLVFSPCAHFPMVERHTMTRKRSGSRTRRKRKHDHRH
jgi:hypothetical protein